MKSERYITGNYVVEAGDSYETIPFQNDVFTNARLIVTLGFNKEACSGVAMELWAYGTKIKRILSLTPKDNTSITAVTEPFNVACLNGFNIVFKNKCLDYSVEIAASKLVMWNDR